MGKGNDAPDPMQTAQAQAGLNRDTAITQYGLGATNQVTPWGSLSYKQIGKWSDGTPRFQATTGLSPDMQNIFDQYTQLANQLGGIGNAQAGNVANTLSQPFQLGNAETEGRLMELGRARLDPLFNQRQAELETKLVNSGLRRGTEAWDNAMQQFSQTQNDAYNNLLLSGRSQAANESLAERNQPLNELMSILGGTQVQQPNFVSTPQPGVQGVDYTGLVQQQYQQQQAQQQALMGGLFGLGAAGLGGWASGL